ncbi:3-dehydroquinate synthase [Candidatus Peregrinibacteria bacterium]|jgi:3-dehydroquinate synthase|nr:3-dehydroquinate synthase [Candidatus Peregrinibacteria bacterium]MBT4631474.1 3-dehydroquinate synthase [Candidatus Peregrinibacteria bacterium]MBT5516580.1 3-dehydroquinate synthase [Candidatus Peregrinibacteria bacterium]MBT5823863.1 3-dehydroquinate synthase [Candidatus Peregrinibacteria bacterium]
MNLPKAHRYIIITDENLAELFGAKIKKEIETETGKQVDILTFPPGDASKSRAVKAKLETQMLALGCGRDTLIVTLGGGVAGDLGGFIAATYMRGIPYVQIPTTLLAMADSSIGGKTGVNTKEGKNLIGAIWHPEKVIRRLEFLDTLSDAQFKSGLFEIIKIFLSHDAKSFAYVEKNLDAILGRDKIMLQEILNQAIKLKTKIVEIDEREKGERKLLSFGHTIGHAIENEENYESEHGFAVAEGVLEESKISLERGHLSQEEFERIEALLLRLNIISQNRVYKNSPLDKKNEAGQEKIVLLKRIGEAFLTNK